MECSIHWLVNHPLTHTKKTLQIHAWRDKMCMKKKKVNEEKGKHLPNCFYRDLVSDSASSGAWPTHFDVKTTCLSGTEERGEYCSSTTLAASFCTMPLNPPWLISLLNNRDGVSLIPSSGISGLYWRTITVCNLDFISVPVLLYSTCLRIAFFFFQVKSNIHC